MTVSRTMAEEIRGFFPNAEPVVVPNGVETALFRKTTRAEASVVQRRLRLPEQFILAVGHLEPRKNFQRLIEAMTVLRGRGTEVSPVISGNDSGHGEVLQSDC